SATSDPRGAWTHFHFGSSGVPDQPRLGVSNDLVVFAVDTFGSTGFTGGRVVVISKKALLAGSLGSSDWATYGPDSRYKSITPAQPVSPQNGMFLVSTQALTSATLYTVTGPAQSSIPVTSVPISALRTPPAAPQPGTSQTIEA